MSWPRWRVLHLTLSGGEPLVHQDFWAIGSHARDRGFVIRIKSNGHAIGPQLARRLKQEVDPFLIEVSLHGACAATHDRQTRVEGSFIQLMRNIQAMLQMGTRVQLNIPLTRWNEAEVERYVSLLTAWGSRFRSIRISHQETTVITALFHRCHRGRPQTTA